MNVTASDVKDAKLTASVTIPAADVDRAIRRAYKDAANKYRFTGFRKGKAPRPVIDAMLGKDAVHAQATEDIVNSNEPAVLDQLDIVPVKAGDYKGTEMAKDHEDFSYQIEYTLRPACELSSYDPVAIEMPPAEVTDAEIDHQVDVIMGYHTTFADVEEDRPVAAEDVVDADIENVQNAEALQGKGHLITAGAGSLPAELDEALLGMKKGETKEVAWTPEGAEDESKVKITVVAIKTKQVPELTDEFVKKSFGFDDVAAMRDGLKEEIASDKAGQLPKLKENRAVAKLAERLQLDEMDPDYENSVFQELGQNFLQGLSARGMNFDQWLQASRMSSDQFISDLHQQANDVARESLALDSLARHLGVEVTDEDVDKEFADSGVKDPAASKKSFAEQGRIPAVRDSIRRSKAVDWLVENAQVTEVDEFAADQKDAAADTAAEAEKAADGE